MQQHLWNVEEGYSMMLVSLPSRLLFLRITTQRDAYAVSLRIVKSANGHKWKFWITFECVCVYSCVHTLSSGGGDNSRGSVESGMNLPSSSWLISLKYWPILLLLIVTVI